MSQSTPQKIDRLLTQLEHCFDECLFNAERSHPNHITLEVGASQFTTGATKIYHEASLQSRYLTLFAVDEMTHFSLHLLLLLKPHQVVLTIRTPIDKQQPQYSALSPHIPAADWHEREIHDLFGIVPIGGNLNPLVLHRDWPRGKHYPMRRDFLTSSTPPIREVPHQFDMPEGAGRHQVVVGPIHAGIIEPGHMRFSVTGEHIHQFDAQLFYTHKGIEKMAEDRHYLDVLALAEHVCGMCAFSHSLAFSQAMETMAGIDIPPRALFMRAILLEMERLASHFADLSAICSAGGFAFASTRVAYFREHILQLNQTLSGHRFLRGFNTVGGLKTDLSGKSLTEALTQLTRLGVEFSEWRNLVLSTDSFLDRVETSGYLSEQTARQLSLVGPSARGSGIDEDMRRDFPFHVHAVLPVTVRLSGQGDVYARMMVRIEEVEESLGQIQRLISTIPDGPYFHSVPPDALCDQQTATGMVESAKGSLIHWLKMGENGTIYRWHVRSAPYMNWRGVIQATMGNTIVPDGPLVNKSFNLCYACADR